MKPLFQLAHIVSMRPDGSEEPKPWFVLETRITSDGMRTRICDGRYKTRQGAAASMELKEKCLEE